MKRFIYAGTLVVAIAFPAIPQTLAGTPQDPHQTLVTTYCVTCHNTRLKTGGLALDGLNLQTPADDAQIWEKALRKLRGHQMPPPGSPQPMQKDVDSFVGWMESTLDTHAKGFTAGYVPIQRLNRTEYAASVKALVGVDVNAKEVLPQDIQVEGFDNIAAALSVSPAFLDQYVTAARQVARLAVGNPDPRVSSVQVQPGRQPECRGSYSSGHARRHPVQTQLPGRWRVSHHDQRSFGRPVHSSARAREHAGHPDR